jgi:hypothetical protein
VNTAHTRAHTANVKPAPRRVFAGRGRGFDPTAAADPVAPEGLEAEHGWGIHLMKSAMD